MTVAETRAGEDCSLPPSLSHHLQYPLPSSSNGIMSCAKACGSSEFLYAAHKWQRCRPHTLYHVNVRVMEKRRKTARHISEGYDLLLERVHRQGRANVSHPSLQQHTQPLCDKPGGNTLDIRVSQRGFVAQRIVTGGFINE